MTTLECSSLRATYQKEPIIRRLMNSLVGLGVLTIVVNAALLFVVIPRLSYRLTPFYNQDRFIDGYDLLAANLIQGNGYRFYPETTETLQREPGYPIILAGILLVFGNNFAAVKAANLCLAVATAWLMTIIARRFSRNRVVVLVPPLLFLFHPGTLLAESRGGIEMLFAFLIALFMLALYRASERNQWWNYAASGAVLGLTVLVRSTLIMFPLFLLAYTIAFERRQISKYPIFRNLACLTVSMFVVLSPWIVRNYLLTGRFVPTASILGVSAHTGQYVCKHLAEGRPRVVLDGEAARERGELAAALGYHFKNGYYQTFYSSRDELNFSSYLAMKVMDEYRRSPLLCVRCISYNALNFWFAGKTWMSTRMNLIVQLPYLILGIAGAALSLRNNTRVAGPLVLLIAYVVAVHLPILAQARYSVPLLPFLSIFAAVALVATRGKAGLGAQHS